MSNPHLDFGREVLPSGLVGNEEASEPFDWNSVFASLDGELETLQGELPERDYQALCDALMRLLAWLFSSRPRANGKTTLDVAIGRRALALGMAVCPNLLPGNQTEIARLIGVSAAALNQARTRAEGAFKTRFTVKS